VKVSNVSGSVVTIDSPVRLTFTAGKNARTRKIVPIKNAGIENLRMQYTVNTTHVADVVDMVMATDCWIRGSTLYWGYTTHLSVDLSARNLINGNTFDTLQYTAPPPNGLANSFSSYGVVVGYGATENEVSNNVCTQDESCVQMSRSPVGNVAAYNYTVNSLVAKRTLFFHGRYPSENLVEGNTGDGQAVVDNFWGQNGVRNVFFRNEFFSSGGDNDGLDLGANHWTNGANPVGGQVSAWEVWIGNVVRSVVANPGCVRPENCFPFDQGENGEQTPNLWAEKNRFIGTFNQGTPIPSTTYVSDSAVCTQNAALCQGFAGPLVKDSSSVKSTGYDGTMPPAQWASFSLPASLYLTSRPSWWCAELPWPAVGADVTNTSSPNKIPAQRRYEGLSCTASTGSTATSLGAPGQPSLIP